MIILEVKNILIGQCLGKTQIGNDQTLSTE